MSMNVSSTPSNVALTYIPTDMGTAPAGSTGKATQTLTLELNSSGKIQVLGNNNLPVELTDKPAPGENIPQALLAAAQELEQSLAQMGLMPTLQDVRNLAQSFAQLMSADGAPPDQAARASALTTVAQKAGSLENQLREVMANSTRPQANDFLKSIIADLQKIAESASTVATALTNSKYNMQMSGVESMKTAAAEDQKSRQATMKAEMTAASVQLAGTLVGAAAGGVALGAGKVDFAGFNSIMQMISTTMTSSTTIALNAKETGLKAQADAATYTADLARASKAETEAQVTLLDAAIQSNQETKQTAKETKSAMMKTAQDAIQAEAQIASSAAAV